MYGYVLQDWITIRGGTQNTPAGDIVQGESTWLGFSSFQDLVIWLDVRESNVTVGNTLTWLFETSPTKDNNLFTPMPTGVVATSGISLTAGFTVGLQPLLKVVLASNPNVPLATWLRWRVAPSASIALPWDATFRVLVAANRVVRDQVA